MVRNWESNSLFLTVVFFLFFIAVFSGVHFYRQTPARQFDQGHSMSEYTMLCNQVYMHAREGHGTPYPAPMHGGIYTRTYELVYTYSRLLNKYQHRSIDARALRICARCDVLVNLRINPAGY